MTNEELAASYAVAKENPFRANPFSHVATFCSAYEVWQKFGTADHRESACYEAREWGHVWMKPQALA